MPFPQHLSNAHHGEPASALDTVGDPQGLRRAVTRPRGRGAHALLFGRSVLIFVSKGDQSGVQRSLERQWASRQQDGRECPLTASQTPRGVQNPVVMGRGEQFCLAVAIHGLEGAHHIQQQGVFLDGEAGAPRPLLRGLRFLHDPGGPGGWHGDELHGGGGHTIGVRGFAKNIAAAKGICTSRKNRKDEDGHTVSAHGPVPMHLDLQFHRDGVGGAQGGQMGPRSSWLPTLPMGNQTVFLE